MKKLNNIYFPFLQMLSMLLLISCQPQLHTPIDSHLAVPADLKVFVMSEKFFNPKTGKFDLEKVPSRLFHTKIEAVWFGESKGYVGLMDLHMFFKTTDKQIPRSWGFNREVKRSYSDYIFRMNIAYDKIHAETGYHELVAKGLRYGLIKTVYVTISETVGLGRVKYVELQDGEICYYLLRQRIVHYERENPDAVLDTRSQR